MCCYVYDAQCTGVTVYDAFESDDSLKGNLQPNDRKLTIQNFGPNKVAFQFTGEGTHTFPWCFIFPGSKIEFNAIEKASGFYLANYGSRAQIKVES